MREANTFDLSLLILLSIIWGSSFFNIKIATYSYDPITLALVRVIFASIPLLILCKFEKLSLLKSIGVLIGFCGIIMLFFDKVIINSENYVYALITILGSTFYCIGGLLTLKIKNERNENVTTSTTLWSVIFLLPCSLIIETPWNSTPTLASTISLLYLGIIATGLAWLIRFRILTVNGLVFQTQVAYLIPIFGVIFGYFLMDETITWRVLFSLVVILTGIYIFKKNNKGIN